MQPEQVHRIVQADDLHIAPYREDGKTPGTPTWIWCVAVDDQLFVRAWHGSQSSWYRSAVREKAGQIRAAGATFDVAFETVDGAINDRIDAAYRGKYRGSKYLDPMVSERSRAATVRIILLDESRSGGSVNTR